MTRKARFIKGFACHLVDVNIRKGIDPLCFSGENMGAKGCLEFVHRSLSFWVLS